ncbi:GPI ethanolamine phosphate transferase 2 [Acipenser oxyrinchus oxyrinchus]|uniref:GPI ethanolamine phosphate transferase 2 n=1 Tax=Acipenser oxyrinchus oxyrinchus TaxID=40147 RepID=A0AAD8LUY2_ACIOX|nr:GPI ethanolamine phosphate transferase 2 [Acipenser oxyrinchus oxyrinchus]
MRIRSSVFASFCLIMEVFGIALFLRGYFPLPVKSSVSAKSKVADLPTEPLAGNVANWTKIPPPLFKRVVIVLIDALREDFVFGPKGKQFMPYTRHLVERGPSHSFVAKARAPTVTMPRIKALMTGSIPGFIDVVMNLNSPALLEDNLMWQAKNAGKKMVFYGDDTWLRLFPKHFIEQDGTTSFFVSDYTEVDNNVTRHLDTTLERDDWDILILHYLGLDHIGHLTGPHSSLIGPKLTEMDDILKKIHTSLMSKEEEGSLPNLLVLCGDHGMSETGSHGGSSEPELNTPLVLISPAFKRKVAFEIPETVEQVDLTPTLSFGLGLPISKNNVGRLILPVLEDNSLREQLRFLHLNGFQLSRLMRDSTPAYEKDTGYEQFRIAERSHGNWMKLYLEGNTSEVLSNMGKKVLKQYLDALKSMSLSLSKQLGKYDMYSMIVGTVIVLQVLFLLLVSVADALSSSAELDLPLSSSLCSLPFYLLCLMFSGVHVMVCTSTESSCYFCSLSWALVFAVIVFVSALLCVILSIMGRKLSWGRPQTKSESSSDSGFSELDILLLTGTLGHVLSLAASSFIEEEHQTWYFLLNTLCLAVFQDVCRKYFSEKRSYKDLEDSLYQPSKDELLTSDYTSKPSSTSAGYEKWLALATPLVTLACCRILRSLNQTGVQWAHLPDFGHWLNSSEHHTELSLLAATSLVLIFFLVQRRCSMVSKIALGLGLLGVYSYRAAVGNVLFPWQQEGRAISKGIVEARFVYIFVLGILFTGAKDLLKSQVITSDTKTKSRGLWEVYSGVVLLAALLFRPHNLPVLVFCLLIQTIMTRFIWKGLQYDAAQTTIMHYWFGQAFFYFQGNSNNIATVDISAGFVGLENYVEIPAIFLTAFSTYAGPLLWASHLVCYLNSETDRSSAAMGHGCYCFALLRSIPAAVYIILATSLRYHLFVWSVFSPKLLLRDAYVCDSFYLHFLHCYGSKPLCLVIGPSKAKQSFFHILAITWNKAVYYVDFNVLNKT